MYCAFSHHIYPVPHWLLQKSTLYPSFLLSSFVFLSSAWHVASPCVLLFGISSFLIHILCCYFLMHLIFAFLSSTSHTLLLVLLFLLLLWLFFSSFLAFLSGLSCFFSASLFVLYSIFPILYLILHVLSLNLWFVLFICFISLFV